MLGEGHTVMESFVDYIRAIVPLQCSTALATSDRVTSMYHADLFRSVMNIFSGKDALQGDKGRHYWKSTIYKGSGEENQCLQKSGVAQYW